MNFHRELENKITRLNNQVSFLKEENSRLRAQLKITTMDKSIVAIASEIICSYYGFDIDAKGRNPLLVTARQHYYYFLKKHTAMSLSEIGSTLYIDQDHSTIIHAIKSFEDHYAMEPKYRDTYNYLESAIIERLKLETKP